MATFSCHACGKTFAAPAADVPTVKNCPLCGHPILISRDRSIVAVERLLEWVRDWENLPEDLRVRIEEDAEQTLDRLIAESKAPPLPLALEPTETPVEEPGEPLLVPEPPALAPVSARRPPPLPKRTADAAARKRAARAEPTGPTIWQRLGPVFAENLLFALAAFLIIAGALYFVTTAWTTMTGSQKLLVVTGGIAVLGAILHFGGRAANRTGTLPELEHVLLVIVAFLLPVAAVPAGLLLVEELPLGLLAAAFVLVPGFFAVRSAAKLEEKAFVAFLPWATAALTVLVFLAPFAGKLPTAAVALAAAALLATVHRFAVRLPESAAAPGPVLRAGLLLSFTHLVFAGSTALAAFREGLGPSNSLPVLGVALSAVGAAAVVLQRRGIARSTVVETGRWSMLLVIALAAAVGGTVAGAGNERALLAAAAIGAFAALVAGYRLPVPALLVPGLILAAVAYLKLPAPFRAFFTMARDKAAFELGYEPKKLPLAWYGITFIPFVALAGLAGAWLVRIGRRARGRVVLLFAMASSLGLATLAITLMKGDLRAPAAVLAAQGALLLLIAPLARDRWFALVGALGVYAGISFALHHLEVSVAIHIAGVAIPGILAVLLAARLARSGAEGIRADIGRALFDAAALTALVLTLMLILKEFPRLPGGNFAHANAPATWPDLPACLLLSLLLCVLGVAYRRPEGGLLGVLVLARAAEAALALCGLEFVGEWRILFFAGASALILPAVPWFERAKRWFHRPHPVETRHSTLLLLPAAAALHGLGMISLVGVEAASSLHVAGLLAGSAVLVAAAEIRRTGWPAIVVAVEIALAGPLAAAALSGSFAEPALLLGFAVSTVMVSGLAFFSIGRRRTAPLGEPFVIALIPMVSLTLLLSLVWLQRPEMRQKAEHHPVLYAVAALVVWAAVRLAHRRQYSVAPDSARFAGFVAGLLPGVLAIALLDTFSARVDLYVAGLVAAGWAAVAAAGRRRFLAYPAAVPFIAALALATVLGLVGEGAPIGVLIGFLLIAASGRLVSLRHREFGSQLLVLGALGAVSLALCHRVLLIEPQWQPVILMLFASAILVAGRFRHSGVTTPATWTIAGPILGMAALMGVGLAVNVVAREPRIADAVRNISPVCLRWSAAAFLFASMVLAARVRGLPRRLVVPGAAALASFACAPVNILLAGNAAVLWRPDVEIAGVSIVLALLCPFTEGRWRRSSIVLPLVYFLAVLAVLITVFQIRHPSTPIAVFLAALAPLALFLRGRRAEDLCAHVVGMLLAAYALTVYVVPRTDAPAAEILLLLAAVTALFVIALTGAARLLRGRPEPWLARAGAELTVVSYLACVVSAALVAANALELSGYHVSSFLAGCGVFACLTAVAIALRQAMAHGSPLAAHGTVWSVLTLHLLLATRTSLLDFMNPYHGQVLAVIGISLMLGGRRWPKVETAFRQEGLLLTIPAILLGFLGLLLRDYGYHPILQSASSALFLAAVAWGVSAHRTRSWGQGAFSAVLLNLAVFAFWRRHGIVDPAFYGIPPGLTLLLGSEVLRGRVEETGRKLLFYAGAVLLYGSVGVQVLRVDEPTHALVLFGLGLATVILGFRLRRNDVLMTGTAVVVLDVIAYFLKHGLSETFLGAALLVAAGLIVLTVATRSARRRRQDSGTDDPPGS